MPRGRKTATTEVEEVPVGVARDVSEDLEGTPIKEVVFTFQALGYVFLVAAAAAAVAWIVYMIQWVDKVYNDDKVYGTSQATSDGKFTVVDRKYSFSFELMTLCFQALVASCLLYFTFRHHYHHQ